MASLALVSMDSNTFQRCLFFQLTSVSSRCTAFIVSLMGYNHWHAQKFKPGCISSMIFECRNCVPTETYHWKSYSGRISPECSRVLTFFWGIEQGIIKDAESIFGKEFTRYLLKMRISVLGFFSVFHWYWYSLLYLADCSIWWSGHSSMFLAWLIIWEWNLSWPVVWYIVMWICYISGYCGDIHVDGRSASVRFEPPPSVIKKYLFDCIWYIPGGYMKISDIKLSKYH